MQIQYTKNLNPRFELDTTLIEPVFQSLSLFFFCLVKTGLLDKPFLVMKLTQNFKCENDIF